MSHSVSLAVGVNIGGYTIVKQLGSGGFGITYLVQDHRGEKFVIKELFIRTNYACSREKNGNVIVQKKSIEMFKFALNRFVDEAKILEKLHHRAIVKVYKHFFENSTAYYVMEYLPGESLEDYVKSKGRLSENETIKYIFPVLEAVKEMHKLGLWHRDIKPANMMITEGRSVLIDFGTVKVTDAKIFSVDQGQSMFAAYSKTFAAPEQKEDLNLTVDHRTDIYSLGATLFYMIMGKPICSGLEERFYGGKDYIQNKLNTYSFSTIFKEVIEKSMEIEKEDRPQSIVEMQKLLIERTDPYLIINDTGDTSGSGGNSQPASSFWSQNWYFILPMAIMLVIAFVLYSNGSSGSGLFFILLSVVVGIGILVKNGNVKNKKKSNERNFRLLSQSGDDLSIILQPNKMYTLGRDPNCDVVVSPEFNYVSRIHLSLYCSNSSISVREYITTNNGTYIDGRRLESNRDYKWEKGEILSLVNGDCTYVWEYT